VPGGAGSDGFRITRRLPFVLSGLRACHFSMRQPLRLVHEPVSY